MTGKKGYTILEILLVLFILSLVLSIAIPSSKIIGSFSEKKELSQFKNHIVNARNNAVLENNTHTLHLNIPNNSYRITKVEGYKTITVVNVKLENGIVLKGENLNTALMFYENGSPNTGGTILLTNSKKDKIEVTIIPATGKINIYINNK